MRSSSRARTRPGEGKRRDTCVSNYAVCRTSLRLAEGGEPTSPWRIDPHWRCSQHLGRSVEPAVPIVWPGETELYAWRPPSENFADDSCCFIWPSRSMPSERVTVCSLSPSHSIIKLSKCLAPSSLVYAPQALGCAWGEKWRAPNYALIPPPRPSRPKASALHPNEATAKRLQAFWSSMDKETLNRAVERMEKREGLRKAVCSSSGPVATASLRGCGGDQPPSLNDDACLTV
jgi:hypothetical protein